MGLQGKPFSCWLSPCVNPRKSPPGMWHPYASRKFEPNQKCSKSKSLNSLKCLRYTFPIAGFHYFLFGSEWRSRKLTSMYNLDSLLSSEYVPLKSLETLALSLLSKYRCYPYPPTCLNTPAITTNNLTKTWQTSCKTRPPLQIECQAMWNFSIVKQWEMLGVWMFLDRKAKNRSWRGQRPDRQQTSGPVALNLANARTP